MSIGTLSITVRWNRLLSASTQLGQQDPSQPQKADDLHEKEPEAYGCHRVGLNETYVHQRLHYAGNQNRDCQRIHKGAGHVSNVQPQNNCAKNRKVFDAVRVCPDRAYVSICSLNLISPEAAYRHTSRQNPTPAVYPNRSEQQQYGPSGESHQHPHGYRH